MKPIFEWCKDYRKTYTIQYLMEQPINRKNWVTMTGFASLQKSFAEGAFCMVILC